MLYALPKIVVISRLKKPLMRQYSSTKDACMASLAITPSQLQHACTYACRSMIDHWPDFGRDLKGGRTFDWRICVLNSRTACLNASSDSSDKVKWPPRICAVHRKPRSSIKRPTRVEVSRGSHDSLGLLGCKTRVNDASTYDQKSMEGRCRRKSFCTHAHRGRDANGLTSLWPLTPLR